MGTHQRGILSTLGQNLVLKDRILTIDLEKSLMPMEKVSAEVLAMHKQLEPRKKRMKQEDYERAYAKNPRLLEG